MKKKSKSRKVGRWLIVGVSFLFTIYAVFLFVLMLFGENKQAKLTSYRQEYGERDETIRNQYNYEFAYEFTVGGKTYSGTGRRISSPVFLKLGSNSTIPIKYLKCCPYLHSHVESRKTWINILVTALVSLVLFWFSKKM
ncbi:MAG TPA: hypothetical protein PK335_00215 [Draconibacterium sp.]|nr:hypothetical protein [Draconibacterium sp.]